MTNQKEKNFEAAIEEKIREIDSTMSLEGMPLTASLKANLRQCYYGTTSPEKEIEKLKAKYRRIYG